MPSYALLTEPEYLNGYKFQIGFITDVGCVDVIYIDILYKTGDDDRDYSQLSDLVEAGTATEEQAEAFQLLRSISEGIVNENDLLYDQKNNSSKNIADIDFSRLYVFLENIEKLDYTQYVIEP